MRTLSFRTSSSLLGKLGRIAPLGFTLLATGACGGGTPAMLTEDNVLVVAEDALWAEIQDTMKSALTPRLPGLLPEINYRISQVPPAAASEADLSRFLQVVILGRPDDVAAAAVLQSSEGMPEPPPALLRRADVWAAGQSVTMLLLPDEGEVEAALSHVDTIARLVDDHYREWTRVRMFAIGENPEISGALAADGIRLVVPAAYRTVVAEDSVHGFMTVGNDQARLIRSVLVTWRPLDDDAPTVESVLAWRQALVDRFHEEAQQTPRDFVRSRQLDGEKGGFEVRGAWNSMIEGQPQGGPFLSRTIDCADQGRRYFLDAWLFAPLGDKYTYLIQLEEVLDSFDCAAG